MADTEVKAIQRRRGTTAEYRTFTSGLQGEITVNITNYSCVISDGLGHNFEAARADMSNVNQINVLQKGIMDNSLSNFPVDYIYNAETGTYTLRAKDSSTIVSQLSNAYIADIELRNVTLRSITSKGIARDDLKNVTFSKVSWNEGETNRLGGSESLDPSGGGLAFRNLSNMFVETFNEFPSSSGAVGGLAYKDLTNVRNITLNTMNSLGDQASGGGVASKNLTNVTSDDFYGVDSATSDQSEGAGKFALKRDLSNVVSVSTTYLDRAGILANDLSNIDFESVNKDDLITLGVALDDLSNVQRNVLIDTSEYGKFKLMSYDGLNADKEKVFKGQKNFLKNSTFSAKSKFFDETSSPIDNTQTFNHWIARPPIVGVTAENFIQKNGQGIIFRGNFSQRMMNVGEIFSNNKVYVSCDASSSFDIKIGLFLNEDYTQGIVLTDGKPTYGTLTFNALSTLEFDENYNRYFVEFDFTKDGIEELLLNKLRNAYSVSLMICSDSDSVLIHPQVELNNVTNWENRSPETDESLSDYHNHKVVELSEFTDDPLHATGQYYRLRSTFSSDPSDDYYASSDLAAEDMVVIGDTTYLPPSRKVFHIKNNRIEYYTISTDLQFEIPSPDQTVKCPNYRIGELAYVPSQNKIYTLVGYSTDLDSYRWLVSEDSRPYEGTLYYLRGETGSWRIFATNNIFGNLEEISTSGSSGSTSLPMFFHVTSDKRMNSVNWVCGDNFSKLYASIYSGAYNYLMDQVYPSGNFIAGGNESSNPSDPDADFSHWLINWSDNDVETTTVLLKTGTVNDIINYCNSKGYTVVESSSNIRQIKIKKTLASSSDTIGTETINFYKTFDGLKVVVDTTGTDVESEKLKTLYNTYGYAWYYLLCPDNDDKVAYFKLPRSKGLEVMGDVHPSYDNTSSGDLYNKKFSEGSTGSVGTYMSTYFYVGATALPREEVELGKTLETLSTINSKSKGICKDVNRIIYDEKYEVLLKVGDEETGYMELDSLVVEGGETYSLTYDPSEEYPEEVSVDFVFRDISSGSTQTLALNQTYNITIMHEGGLQEDTTLKVTVINQDVTDTITVSDTRPVVLIATARNLNLTFDFDFSLQSENMKFISFDLIIDRRSRYNGSITISNCTLPALTDEDVNYLRVVSYVADYGDIPYQYNFKALKQ